MAGVRVDEPILPSSFPNPRSSGSAACTQLLSGLLTKVPFRVKSCTMLGYSNVEKDRPQIPFLLVDFSLNDWQLLYDH